MDADLILRAWTDDDFLEGLSEEQRLALPENPAGEIELDAVPGLLGAGDALLDTEGTDTNCNTYDAGCSTIAGCTDIAGCSGTAGCTNPAGCQTGFDCGF